MRLDIIAPEPGALTVTAHDKWHQRFGHLSRDAIKTIMNNGAVDGLRLDYATRTNCLDCALSKCFRAGHPLRLSPKLEKPGLVQHFDLIGPNSPASVGSSKFILNCIDEFSKFRLTAPLRGKGETPEMVKLMINQIKSKEAK